MQFSCVCLLCCNIWKASFVQNAIEKKNNDFKKELGIGEYAIRMFAYIYGSLAWTLSSLTKKLL